MRLNAAVGETGVSAAALQRAARVQVRAERGEMSRAKGRFVVGATLAAVVLALAASGGAGAGGPAAPLDESAHVWFVQLAGAPGAKGGDKAALRAARQRFFQGAADQGLGV